MVLGSLFLPLIVPGITTMERSPDWNELREALEGDPHIVRYEFIPETSDELAVVPGNIVFVLQKGSDNWASVVFNGRKGLVPYNYLERMEMSLDTKQKNELSEPPNREPPTRPERKQGLNRTDRSNGDLRQEEAQLPDNSCIVKVHYTFNFAVSLTSGSTYSTLIEKISKKLNVSTVSVTLRLTSDPTSVLNDNTDMESVWGRAQNKHLTLWCNIKDQTGVQQPQNEIVFVALHSYESSNPEDLNFNQGDKITLISKINQDWLEGHSNGNTGIFPVSFVEEVPVNDQ